MGPRDLTERKPEALVVLGCPTWSAAFARRVDAAAAHMRERPVDVVMACGGRAWAQGVEADVLATRLVTMGVPAGAIVRERCSLDTRDNARFAAAMLGRRGISRVVLVTCSWHLPRATRLFEAAGLEVDGHPVPPPSPTLRQRAYWAAREALSSWKDARRPMRIV